MATTAISGFTITSWEATPYDEGVPGPKMTSTVVKKSFTGAMIGTSVAQLLTCESESGGAGYLAMERVEGTLDGHEGTFVIQHGGLYDAATGESIPYGAIVPGSATGELAGLRGGATFRHDENGAILTLHYEL